MSTEIRNELTWDQKRTLEALGEKMAYFDRRWVNNLYEALLNDTLFKGESLLVDKRWANRAFNGLGGSAVVAYQIMKSLVKIYYYDFIDANVRLPGVLNSDHLDFEKQLNHFFEELEWIRKQRAQLEMIIPSLTSHRD
ncbi:hypothetical protein IWW56_000907 [Coemansia sp. RSA 2131]|nr:hypothetical protein IWW56_000907 [Coemansia sp. RSA 2131]